MNATQDDKVEAKRASNRERQRRYRQQRRDLKIENARLQRELAQLKARHEERAAWA